MHNTYTTQIETGTSVYGSDGEKFGEVAEVSNDYFVIEKGFIFTTDLFVPMSAISGVDEDGVRLSMTKDQVENSDWSDAPVAGTVHDTDDTYVAGRTDDTYATERTDDTYVGTDRDLDDSATLERREERLTVDKETQQAGSVRVGKHVEEDVQSVDVPVTREEVTIDRHSVDRPAGGDAFTEDSIDVPVYEETVDVDKEARVVEELEVGKTARTDTAHVEETVRREEFDIDDETGTTRRDR
jgi:uncharacterized protein (TIGR02271 family)